MPLETIIETCPLCQRQMAPSAGNTGQDSTRLCDECKSIVQSIRPRANNNWAEPVQSGIHDHRYQEPAFQQQQSPISFVVEELPREQPQSLESFHLDLAAAPFHPAGEDVRPEQTPSSFHSGNGGGLDTNPLEPEAAAEETPKAGIGRPPTPQPAAASHELDDAASLDSLRASVEVNATRVPPAPAQSWPVKQQQTEWPLVIAPPERRSPNLKHILVVPLILAVVAGGYFGWKWFNDRPASKLPGATTNQNAGPGQAAHQPAAPPQKPAPPASGTAPTAAGDTAKKETAPPRAANDNGQGRFSLQAASFPNEAAANEFSEKLISAGVAAHVSSADLAGKGRWYRVKVGRFNTAEEANKFAIEAKQRAKSKGINLQLMPSEY